jgi:acetate---CoA ligase (ADP-forming)
MTVMVQTPIEAGNDVASAAAPATGPMDGLDTLFHARCIAVVGASDDAARIGGVPLSLMIERGYGGRLVPINPKYREVQGLPAFPTLAAAAVSIAQRIDVAIVAVPAAALPAVLEDAIAAGVNALVIFSSGLAEVGDEGRVLQHRLAQRASAAGVRLLGPNCLGMMSFRDNIFATFSPAPRAGANKVGSIAIVSQSGAFGAFAFSLARDRGLGMSYWMTTGNEADIDFADCVQWLSTDPHTKVILGYMEGCRDGEKLKTALQAARTAGKRVVIVKVGRSEIGAAAAASHTAALTGEDAVYDALFQQYGVWRARTIDELFTVGYAASVCDLPASARTGLLTVSGGVGVLMADEASEVGLDIAEMPAPAQAALLKAIPFAGARNPVDITGQTVAAPGLLSATLENMLGHGPDQARYDMVLFFPAAALLGAAVAEKIVADLIAGHARHPDVPLAVTGLMLPKYRDAFAHAGIAVIEDPSAAVRALGALAFFARTAGREPTRAKPAGGRLSARMYTEHDALQQLAAADVPVVRTQLAASSEEAARAARDIGFPVVVKLSSPDITHKSDVGGVKLNLADENAVRAAFEAVMANGTRAAPGARIDGVVVAPMVKEGIECILGVQTDPVFGPVVMFGLGGVLVEAMRDVSFRLAPIDLPEARAMVDEIRARRVLHGMRGKPAADIDALCQAIVRLSEFAAMHVDSLTSVDINPFVVMPRGSGAIALDAVLITRHESA